MKYPNTLKHSVICGLLLAATSTYGAILASWDFGTNDGSAVSVAATTLNPSLSPSILTRGAGAGPEATNDTDVFAHAAFDQTSLANAITNNNYFEWVISSASATVSLSALNYSVFAASNGTTPENFSGTVQYSLNGFSTAGTAIQSFTGVTASNAPRTPNPQFADLTGVSALQNIASGTSVTFRFYGYNGASWTAQGIGRTSGDDLVISGTALVPEPSTYAALAGLVVLGLAFIRRRK